jgi:serine/threonine protein kinase
VRRTVAVKVIKRGMDTREVIARFDAERQALAMMDHPHIAQVLEAGSTPDGQPFFVMDYVAGLPIGEFCAQQRLDIAQRIEVFLQICAAVQHAHSKGVMHRDIKPSNVIVSNTAEGAFAKVIDFGIAKATAVKLAVATQLTGESQMIGTPLYMSPEQAVGDPHIDTRTDVYSLGAVLYELLTDTTPLEAQRTSNADYSELIRLIREDEPLAPSRRLRSEGNDIRAAAATRRTNERALVASITGDLDWIVMKAIEKERDRRYGTASELAGDLRRYLIGDPVEAAPPSVRYRLAKLARRHKGLVASSLLLTLSLAAGVAAFAWQANLARSHVRQLERVAAFQANMIKQVDVLYAGRFSQRLRCIRV